MPSPRPARFRRRRPRWRGTEMRAMISTTRRAAYPALRSHGPGRRRAGCRLQLHAHLRAPVAARAGGLSGGRRCRARGRDRGATGCRDRLAPVLCGRAAAPADRARARQQSRPARRGAQHRAGEGALPDPARRAVPGDQRDRQRQSSAGTRDHQPDGQHLHQPQVRGQHRLRRLRARSVRPHPQPQPAGARAVLRHGRGAAQHADQPDRRGRERVFHPRRRPGAPEARAGHA